MSERPLPGSGGTIAVLGAGLQGVCCALALHEKGYRVLLIDQSADCLLRASLRNEGKIHLGYTYANDPSLRTTELMLRSATGFAPLIESWVGGRIDWQELRSPAFTYVVMRDSMLSREQLLEHYGRVGAAISDLPRHERRNYIGRRLENGVHEVAVPSFLAGGLAMAAVATPEISIDPLKLRALLKARLESCHGIRGLYRHRVESVRCTSHGFEIEGRAPGARWTRQVDQVVNCLWEGRLRIDDQMGLEPEGDSWVYRLKYRVLAQLPESLRHLPALTFAFGAYGDVVPYGESCYLSWYPVCRQGWCSELSTPESWEAACEGRPNAESARPLSQEVITAFDRLIPGMGEVRPSQVDAGVIFSWGATDIDRHDSELHTRHKVGVRSQDGYHSINTGKLTCAPLFATQLADRL